MTGRWAVLAGAAIVLAATPARADVAADAQKVAGACTAQGGIGFTFGQAEQDLGPSRPGLSSSRFVKPSEGWAPFGDVEVVVTYQGRRVHSIGGEIAYGEAGEARAVMNAAAKLLEGRGLKRTDNRMDPTMADFASADGLAAARTHTALTGFRVSLSASDRTLTLQCIDNALIQRSFDEFAGKIPLAEKPAPPQLTPPPRPAPGACDAPQTRAATIRDFKANFEKVAEFGQQGSRYAEQVARWKGQQLVKLGVWTKAEQDSFQLRLVSDPEWLRLFKATTDALMGILDVLQRLGKAEQAADEAAQCHASLDGIEAFHRLVAGVWNHWAFVIERYDAEAARLHVNLS